ncbi:hypothetical protein [Oricola sp.]|uniref:hypothetical protein n=1 Tax=Oricola sp. TaxID=1979950 RepID=UPI0025CF0826|nr:hypothetical protein [Oricola sp.]MCI5074746.1 hypothetical protein [Oricola sp.]
MSDKNSQYDARTLAAAAAIFIGFALIIFFLPNIMLAVGEQNRVLAGAVVIGVLVLPFVGLWLRGRMRRKGD